MLIWKKDCQQHFIIMTSTIQLKQIWSYKYGQTVYYHSPGLPYAPFMKFNLYQITQHALYKMKKHWEIQTLLCDDEQIKAEALGFQKLITMFIVFIMEKIGRKLQFFIE